MLRFGAFYESVPWGGTRFKDELGRDAPAGPVGESWELVELPERESVVAQGPHAGERLGALWRAGRLGGSAKGPFPFLLKWLDTTQPLSVQVHPDEQACTALGQGAAPKTEAWYFAELEAGAALWLGHYPGLDAATLELAAKHGTIAKWLYETQPRRGDMVLVEAGTLHAIGPGFFLLEVQQPSATTYRVFDWGRVGLDGQPRKLHLDEAKHAVRYERAGQPRAKRDEVRGPCFVMRPLRRGAETAPGPLRVFVAVDGDAQLQTARGAQPLAHGEVVVAEPEDGTVKVTTGAVVFLSEA